MGQIFISYRRKDSAGHSGRLHDRLCYWFEKGRLFFDRESIKGGEVFSAVIEEAVRSSEVLLAVIGPDWLDDEHRPRLHQEGDLVRREIALALELAKGDEHRRVIPLLCGGASMPSKDDLPEDLLSLCELNAIELSEADYDFSFEKLLDTIRSPKLKPVFQTAHHTRPSNLPVKKLTPYFADPLNMLSALRKALEDDGSALVSTAIHGMGGVGKTQLALKYGATFCDDYAGVWWFSSEDPLLLEQGCAELCKEMHIQRAEKEPASSAAKDWLRKTPGRWLLIYDNVEEPSMIKELIPEKGEHHIIYTSRTPHWGSLVAKNAQVEIKSWSAEQAQEFLSLRLPEATREQNLSLAEALGGLPLALEQACAYIDRIRISIETYCERVMELLDKADPTSNYHASVEATLALAFDKLSPAAKELLALASYCAPEPIPDLLFRASAIVSNDEEREGLLPPALLTAASDELLWGETRAELTGFALAQLVDIDLTPAGSDDKHIENALVLHRLTQAAAIKRLEQGDSSLEMLIALLYRAYPQDMNSHRNWPLAAALAPHVKHYQETFETTTIAFKALSWLFDRYATYLQYGQALYDEAIDLFKMLLERDKVVHGKDHPSTLTSMNNLALTLKAMGDHAGARVLHEQELQKCKEILGEDHPSTLTS
ncbi:MAG: tetratricopeptide repeat protein, partial [Desulfuromonadales bacterium]|nr:tetratricopeptide repeat protein [Desulfuromonadales bacterium]